VEVFSAVWTWAQANSGALTVILTVLIMLTSIFRFWTQRPHLALGVDEGSKPESVTITLTNIGGRPATDVNVWWVRRSKMEMELTPGPKVLLPSASLSVELSMAHDDRTLHNLSDSFGGGESPFGYVVASWHRVIRDAKTGKAVIPSGAFGKGRLSGSVTFGRIPRTPVRQSRLAQWLDEASGRRARREQALSYSWQVGRSLQLANALKSINEAGVILPEGNEEDKTNFALEEMSGRGWSWDFDDLGSVYRVDAQKKYFPSTGASVTAERPSLYEAAVIALDMAMDSDREQFKRMS